MIRRLLSFLAAVLVLLVPAGVSAQYDPGVRSTLMFHPFYDPTAVVSCTLTGSPTTGPAAANNNIYILGDSLTVGMRDAGNLEAEVTNKGWHVAKITAEGGKPIGWGIEQVQADAGMFADPNGPSTILVGLGTNDVGSNDAQFENSVRTMVQTLRSFNPNLIIYWTNLFGKGTYNGYDIAAILASHSAVLERLKTELNIAKILPWANSAVAQSSVPNNDVHPKDYPAMAQFIASELPPPLGGAAGGGGVPTGSELTYGGKTLPPAWFPILAKAAARFKVDPNILAGIMYVETGWDTPESFATNPRRNRVSATGPFQFLDDTTTAFMTTPDQWGASSHPYTAGTVKAYGETGSEFEADGSLIADGNKDGKVDRATPEDAALMAAAFVRSLNAGVDTPIGEDGDYVVPYTAIQEINNPGSTTVRTIAAHYNQGPAWTSSNAVQGSNNVVAYMDGVAGATLAGRNANVFSGEWGSVTAKPCNGTGTAGGYQPGNIQRDQFGTVTNLEGLVYYSQRASKGGYGADENGNVLKYGISTIPEAGCGPSSMAMIVSTLTGQKITPFEMGEFSVSVGGQEPTGGSYGSILSKEAAAHWGLQWEQTGRDPAKITAALQAGKLILVGGEGEPFSSGGHIIVLRAITPEGKILVGDPSDGDVGNPNYLRKSLSSYDMGTIISFISDSTWAVWK